MTSPKRTPGRVRDPLAQLGPNDTCWCGTIKKYKKCHGDGSRISAPGAPVPDNNDQGIWLSPTTVVAHGAFQTSTGFPFPFRDPTVPYRPQLLVTELAAELAAIQVVGAPDTLSSLGAARFDALTELGLDSLDTLDAQLDALSADAIHELITHLLLLARHTLDVLAELSAHDDPPTTLWATDSNPRQFAGQTLFWAHHYLVPDPIADAALDQRATPDAVRDGIRTLLELRPLIEAGLVVPMPVAVAKIATSGAVEEATGADLERRALLTWIERQLIVEGPTAREALFISARDDTADADFHLLGTTELEDDGTFRSRMLGHYDPSRDYSAWINETRHKAAAGYLFDANQNVAIADAFGGHYITRSPFRARLIREQQNTQRGIHTISSFLDVPHLPEADSRTLASIATNEECVANLRAAVRTAISDIEDHDDIGRLQATQALVDELANEAVTSLRRDIRRNHMVEGALGAGCTLAGLLLTAAPPLALAAGVAAPLAPYLANQNSTRGRASYAFLTAARSQPRRTR